MTMPVFAMSCFKLQIDLCKKLTSVMMEFWWNTKDSQKKIHWISSDKLTMRKALGGIGFKDLTCFNQALLVKQAWRIVDEPNSLLSLFFKNRYFENGEFLQAPSGTRPSFAWKSMLFGRELLKKSLHKSIGDGKNTLVWVDNGLYDGRPCRPGDRHSLVNIDLTVDELINLVTGNLGSTQAV